MVLKQPANLKYPRRLWLRGETDCGAIERPLGLLCAFFCTCVYSCVSGWASVRQSVHGRANVPGCTQIYCTVQLFGICHNGELKHELIPDKEQLYLKQLHYSLWTLFVFFSPIQIDELWTRTPICTAQKLRETLSDTWLLCTIIWI